MLPDDPAHLIDAIYEAAVAPELWPEVLQHLSAITGGAGASIVAPTPTGLRWVATREIDELIRAHVETNAPMNSRIAKGFSDPHAGFRRDQDIFSDEEMDSDPFYRDFMRPRGFGWFAGTIIQAPSTDPSVFAVEKRGSDGPMDLDALARLDRLRPHLARACVLSARFALEQVRSAAAALEVVGLPAAVLGRDGRVLAVNPSFESYMPTIVQDRSSGRPRLVDAAADALLAEALARSCRGAGVVGSIPLVGEAERPALLLHVVPIRGAACDVFTSASALLLVTPAQPAGSPTAPILEGLFDLTAAEARVARGIGQGHTIDEVAESLRVSRETVRAQLKAVFAKTGTGRQTELVRLLSFMPGFAVQA